MITSIRNPKIQWVRKLQAQAHFRREEKAFVVEGVRLVEEALQSNLEISLALYTEGLDARGQELVRFIRERNFPVEEVSSKVLEAASDTQTPQGILVVVPFPNAQVPEGNDFLLIADGVRDPGNMGTILRTAAAAGVGVVLLTPGTVDAYNPKVVRAGMGAHFRLPVLSLDWEEIRMILSKKDEAGDYHIYLADAGGGQNYTQADYTSRVALILGGEAQGVGSQALGFKNERLHIPMLSEVESLNVAVAAAILLFEVVRQRQLRKSSAQI